MKKLYAVILLVLVAACTRVDVTEHCVMTRYGKVVEKQMAPGLAWMPIADATCFPLTEQNYPPTAQGAETIEAQTADPLTVQGDVAIVYSYDPTTVFEVFTEKRSVDAAEIEIRNAIREGYRNAIAAWTVQDIFSPRRGALSDSVRTHIQRKIGDRAKIRNVFLRDIRAPQQIEAARIESARQAQKLTTARQQYTIDSVNAAGTVLTARAAAEAQRLTAVAFNTNRELVGLRIAEAYANGLAKACSGAAVQTCIIGASTLDALFKPQARN